jgi:hypothetical protein
MVRTLALLGGSACSVACGRVADGSETEPCEPWRPRGGAWTSLATERPPVLESSAASADGRRVYAVGSWLENGVVTRGLLRSSDLGQSWCSLPTLPEPPTRVVPSGAGVLYVESARDDRSAPILLKSMDDGATWKVGASPGIQTGTLIVAAQDPTMQPTRTSEVRHATLLDRF